MAGDATHTGVLRSTVNPIRSGSIAQAVPAVSTFPKPIFQSIRAQVERFDYKRPVWEHCGRKIAG
jgi:hypothetical protein